MPRVGSLSICSRIQTERSGKIMGPTQEGIFTKLGVLVAAVTLAVTWYYASNRSGATVTPSPVVSSPAPVTMNEPSPATPASPPPNVEPPATTAPDRSTPSTPSSAEPTPQAPEREPPRPAAPEILRVRVGDHVFQLKKCILSGTDLECEALITNEGQDRTLYLFSGNSRLIDEGGTEYTAVSLTLGGGGGHVPVMTFGANKPPAATDLTTGVPVKAVLRFEGIPSGTKRAALIEIQEAVGGFYGGRGLKAQFRNVPLEQQ